jgi:PPOX class probable F420-dependent enzyme
MPDSSIQPGAHAESRLRNDIVGWLTTVRPSGQPDSVPVWFLWTDDQRILIYSRPNKQKLHNLERNPKVTLAIDDTKGGDDVTRVEGTAEYVADHPALYEVPAYVEKYHDHILRIGYGDPETFARDYSAAIVITPTRFRSWV